MLERAEGALGIELSTLRERSEFSTWILSRARERLPDLEPPEGEPIDVVVHGSFAREEASPESDFDFLVIAHGLPGRVSKTRDVLTCIEKFRSENSLGEPGRTGMFGKVVSAPDLTERIGLEQDTNLTHSRRVLILEESVSVYQPERHAQLVRTMLDRYLVDYGDDPKRGVPRFLLNDVLRYWRTLTVDYQAKRWEELDNEWGLRYFKLRLTRKIALAGTLATLLRPLPLAILVTKKYLVEQFDMPALARLAQLETDLSATERDHLATVLRIADEFADVLGSSRFRENAEKLDSLAEAKKGDFAEWHEKGKEVQRALEGIFFESDLLGAASRKYVSF